MTILADNPNRVDIGTADYPAAVTIDPPARPYWLDQPCPAWCVARHSDSDAAEDRIHCSAEVEVPLALDDPVNFGRDGFLPEFARASIRQWYREAAPAIEIGKGGAAETFVMTEAEVRQFANGLFDLADAAAAEQPRQLVRSVA